MPNNTIPQTSIQTYTHSKLILSMLLMVAGAHLINDLIQSVLTAIYPLLKTNFDLTFSQIGLISLVYQITASMIQPWVGLYTDKHPMPYLLPMGMGVTLLGICTLAFAPSFAFLLIAATLIGLGSSTFHPEASRVARIASGGRFGTAQSTFQVGGNTGSAIGPLLAALLIVPHGQVAVVGLVMVAGLGIWILYQVSQWMVHKAPAIKAKSGLNSIHGLEGKELRQALMVIAILMVAKFTYIASLTNYYTFYLMDKFDIPLSQAQLHLFAFLAAVALGTFAGGPIGDKIGRNKVIWFSFIGMAPFALALPYMSLFWTSAFAILAGLIMSSAFSAMVVYVQEAMPGRVGMVAGIMFGFMFGISGTAAAGLGTFADIYGIQNVFYICALLPLLGLANFWLPNKHPK